MRLFIGIQAGKPEKKAFFKAWSLDEARVDALIQGFVIVKEV